MAGWSIPGDEEKIARMNAELPARRARHEAWRKRTIELRKEANEAERKAASFWVAGFGHTNPAAWEAAADAAAALAKHAEEGIRSGAWTDHAEGTLEWTQAKHGGLGASEYATAAAARKSEASNRETAAKARENEQKIAAKKAADAAAAAKAVKSAAAAEKRKATLAAKKAAGGPAVKKWAGS